MFLCCGADGSGKTTTLYARASARSTGSREHHHRRDRSSITSTHRPDGDQHQTARTFAGSLRSILRQEPDVIMIGEIRDQETAMIACQARRPAHGLLHGHANATVTALFRLLDLGVEPFMIARR